MIYFLPQNVDEIQFVEIFQLDFLFKNKIPIIAFRFLRVKNRF